MVLNDLVDTYMQYCQDSESPDRFLRWSALAGIASVAQRKIWIDWGDLQWFPCIYVILAGPPATRKSTAMREMRQMLIDVGVPVGADSITREKFIRRLCESQATSVLPNGEFFNHCSFALWSSELGSLLNKSSEQLIMDLTDLYDAPSKWEYDTKHQGTDSVYGCCVSLIAATTPESFRRIVPVEAVGTGFTSRVIFVCARAKRKRSYCPTYATSTEGRQLRDFMKQRLLDIYSISGQFKGTEKFAEAYINFYASMSDEPPFDPDNFGHYWDRRMQNLMKCSILYALSRGAGLNGVPRVLEIEDFDRARETLLDAETEMPLIFANFGRSKQADLIQKIMTFVFSYPEGVSRSTLARRFIKDASSYELSIVIETLVNAKLLLEQVGSGGGLLKCNRAIL